MSKKIQELNNSALAIIEKFVEIGVELEKKVEVLEKKVKELEELEGRAILYK